MRLASLLLVFCLMGCAASEPVTSMYEPRQGRTVYQTKTISLGSVFRSGGISNSPPVVMRGRAECPGRDCRPEETWLLFSMDKSSQDFRVMSDRTITLQTESERYEWPQKDPRRPSSSHGEIARVALSFGALEDLAYAQDVSGSIGNSAGFTLSYEQRAPLRAFVEEVKER